MSTEAKPSVRKDALVAAVALGVLGVLWIVFRLYWQGLCLLVACSAVTFFALRSGRGQAPEASASAPADKPSGRADKSPAKGSGRKGRAEGSRRGRKRKRRR